MTSAEARRRDLYNGLTEMIGAERTETLMAYLPSSEYTDLANLGHLNALETRLTERIDGVETRLTERIDGVETRLSERIVRLEARMDAFGSRLDRIVLAIIAALVVVVARSFF